MDRDELIFAVKEPSVDKVLESCELSGAGEPAADIVGVPTASGDGIAASSSTGMLTESILAVVCSADRLAEPLIPDGCDEWPLGALCD